MEHIYARFEVLSIGTIDKLGQFLKTAFCGVMVPISVLITLFLNKVFTKKHVPLLVTVFLCALSFTARAQPGQQVINSAVSDQWILQRSPNWSNNYQIMESVLGNPNLFPTPGKPGRNGLRIDVNLRNTDPLGNWLNGFQAGTFRVYDNYRENFSKIQTAIRFGNSNQKINYDNGVAELLGDACSTTPVSGSGTTDDPFVVTNVFKVESKSQAGRFYNELV